MFKTTEEFDGAAATTRSLLGYGVLAGVVYLVFGVTLGATRAGFEFSKHALSLLMLGDSGWLQRVNLVIAGLMVLLAALGVRRAGRDESAVRRAGAWIGAYGICLVASAFFAPDPAAGFPAGTAAGGTGLSLAGGLHLAFGAVGFFSVVAGAVTIARWHRDAGRPRHGSWSRIAAGVVLAGFLVGAALSSSTSGIVLLWLPWSPPGSGWARCRSTCTGASPTR